MLYRAVDRRLEGQCRKGLVRESYATLTSLTSFTSLPHDCVRRLFSRAT